MIRRKEYLKISLLILIIVCNLQQINEIANIIEASFVLHEHCSLSFEPVLKSQTFVMNNSVKVKLKKQPSLTLCSHPCIVNYILSIFLCVICLLKETPLYFYTLLFVSHFNQHVSSLNICKYFCLHFVVILSQTTMFLPKCYVLQTVYNVIRLWEKLISHKM